MSERDAVEIGKVSKRFRIYHYKPQSLKERFLAREAYEEFWALRDVDLRIRKGETIAFIGPNGSGKSTLLKVVCGILKPTTGKVRVSGKIAALLELGAGFQGDLTGRENIYLNAAILGLSRKEIDARFDRIVEFSELEKFIDNQVKYYSSGMYMRLGFSVAVNVDPDILLIDEVMAVGDEGFQKKCIDKLKEFQDAGKTIVIVTHDVGTAAVLCDRVAMFDHGEIKELGKPKDVIKEYRTMMYQEDEAKERGTREVVIDRVRLLDSSGTEQKVFSAGEPMSIEINYVAGKPIEDAVFGIAVNDQRNLLVFGTNTARRSFVTGHLEGPGAVTIELGYLPMFEGKYSVTVAIHSSDEKTVYHWQEGLYPFEVVNSANDVGLVSIPVDMRLRTGPALILDQEPPPSKPANEELRQ